MGRHHPAFILNILNILFILLIYALHPFPMSVSLLLFILLI